MGRQLACETGQMREISRPSRGRMGKRPLHRRDKNAVRWAVEGVLPGDSRAASPESGRASSKGRSLHVAMAIIGAFSAGIEAAGRRGSQSDQAGIVSSYVVSVPILRQGRKARFARASRALPPGRLCAFAQPTGTESIETDDCQAEANRLASSDENSSDIRSMRAAVS